MVGPSDATMPDRVGERTVPFGRFTLCAGGECMVGVDYVADTKSSVVRRESGWQLSS